MWLVLCATATADTLRIATYNPELARKGPGLLLRDIEKGSDPQIAAVTQVIVAVSPDILVLQSIDYDHDLLALAALRDVIAKAGLIYPHIFARRPNSGWQTGRDMDGDGRVAHARDAQGYGEFAGQGGLAMLSRYPIETDGFLDFSTLLWRDAPGAELPQKDGQVFPTSNVYAHQRLSSVGHWVVPVQVPGLGWLTLMTCHATPPVFDGPEDRNGLRNKDEVAFWAHFLDGAVGTAPKSPFVVLGDFNVDPETGDGRKAGIRALLDHPYLADPFARHSRQDRVTVDWANVGLPPMRVSYLLPDRHLNIVNAGVYWPRQGPEADLVSAASRHRVVWVDIALPP